MGDRSTSGGVRNIRAMFEAKNESTSPPSRGRSPVGSEGVRSTSSRSVSKIRTSFVAVERSGQMGPILGLRRVSDTLDGNADGTDSKLGAPKADQQPNGSSMRSGSMEPLHNGTALANVKEEEAAATGDIPANQQSTAPTSMKGARGTENGNGAALASRRSTSGARGENTEDLGSVLKGSPFESAGAKGSAALRSGKASTLARTADTTAKAASPSPSITSKANGEANGTKKQEAKPTPTRPAAISTKLTTAKSGPVKDSKGGKSPMVTTPKTPTTPKAVSQPKVNSPRGPKQAIPKKDGGLEAAKGPVRKSSRISLESQGTAAESTSKLATPSATTPVSKKSQPTSDSPVAGNKKVTTSSPGGFVKPPVKSPTRPVRLPASATAPTASFAAKTGTPVSRSPSQPARGDRKPSLVKTDRLSASKGPLTSSVLQLKKQTSRASISSDRPKSSASAHGKAPDEGFLARMMRPTASSASKTHEKVEPKSPPSKVVGRPKRKSEAGGEEVKVIHNESRKSIGSDEGKATQNGDGGKVVLNGTRGKAVEDEGKGKAGSAGSDDTAAQAADSSYMVPDVSTTDADQELASTKSAEKVPAPTTSVEEVPAPSTNTEEEPASTTSAEEAPATTTSTEEAPAVMTSAEEVPASTIDAEEELAPADTATEPSAEPIAKSIGEPSTEPIVEPSTEPTDAAANETSASAEPITA